MKDTITRTIRFSRLEKFCRDFPNKTWEQLAALAGGKATPASMQNAADRFLKKEKAMAEQAKADRAQVIAAEEHHNTANPLARAPGYPRGGERIAEEPAQVPADSLPVLFSTVPPNTLIRFNGCDATKVGTSHVSFITDTNGQVIDHSAPGMAGYAYSTQEHIAGAFVRPLTEAQIEGLKAKLNAHAAAHAPKGWQVIEAGNELEPIHQGTLAECNAHAEKINAARLGMAERGKEPAWVKVQQPPAERAALIAAEVAQDEAQARNVRPMSRPERPLTITALMQLFAAGETLLEFWSHGTPVQPGSDAAADFRAAMAAARLTLYPTQS